MAGKALRQMYRKQVPLSIRTKDRCSSDLIKEKTSTMGDNSNAIRSGPRLNRFPREKLKLPHEDAKR
ncbi:hypothetical protein C0Q70_04303 [Pomacea canaliculata]|uniref:Uncharacterized protein n=1 Tax=Pomacea canaliculata TaxID=400727 RepID=A0A2T7PV49_POMCA|nr:hypothetical protein C0Q70_04303 [Pomacea canaliculata]